LSLLIEAAADELGRLDSTSALAPGAAQIALRLGAIAGLTEHTPSAFRALVAAEAEPIHDALLSPSLLSWRTLIEAEEKRVRGGARLAVERFANVAADLEADVPSPAVSAPQSSGGPRERLEAIWREPSGSRGVLERAVDSAAWSPSLGVAEAGAALLLCAGGRTDRVRILPFVDVPVEARTAAIDGYRSGEPATWTEVALKALASRARSARLALLTMFDAPAIEEEQLRPLGRAAITARASLDVLRRRLATTIPALAEDLRISRPAASDALERLAALGLAREVTGRARDRVFAYGAAVAMGESLLPAEEPAATP